MDDRRSTSDVRGRRFQAGDPLRGLACLGILTWHTVVSAVTLTPPAGVSPDWHTELGVLGRPTISIMMSVWLFFALSGYLIAGPFVRHIVLDSDRRPRLRAYARNRLLRIVPAFWLFLTLTVVLLGTRGNSVRQMVEFYGFAHVFDKGPFTERMVQAWTLDVEVAFYVCVPLLLLPASRLLRGRGTPLTRAGIIVAACAAVAVASLALGVRWPGGGQILPGSAWAFTPGVALAAIQPLLRPRIEGRRAGRMLAWGLLAVALAGFLSAAYVFEYNADTAENVCALLACGGLLGGALVYEWATGAGLRWLDVRPLHWVGARSYSIYLVHVLVIYELRPLTRSGSSAVAALLLVLPLVLLVSLAVGDLSWRYFERPLLQRRLPWRTAEPVPSDGPPMPAPALTPAVATTPAEAVNAP